MVLPLLVLSAGESSRSFSTPRIPKIVYIFGGLDAGGGVGGLGVKLNSQT